eukprot:Gb_35689 [translate_table: standard]
MAMKSFLEKVKGFKVPTSISEAKGWIKKPWEITGPCADPEYLDSVPNALSYRPFSPATPAIRVYIPQAQPERVFDIKYFPRDTRRNFRDRKSYVLTKAELEAEQKDKTFDVKDFPPCYVIRTQIVDLDNLPGNGYQ